MSPPAASAAATRTRPIEKFAKAVGQCSTEATAYGRCVFHDYNNVWKDKCLEDFMKLRNCVMKKR